jgi:hypothetical protein
MRRASQHAHSRLARAHLLPRQVRREPAASSGKPRTAERPGDRDGRETGTVAQSLTSPPTARSVMPRPPQRLSQKVTAGVSPSSQWPRLSPNLAQTSRCRFCARPERRSAHSGRHDHSEMPTPPERPAARCTAGPCWCLVSGLPTIQDGTKVPLLIAATAVIMSPNSNELAGLLISGGVHLIRCDAHSTAVSLSPCFGLEACYVVACPSPQGERPRQLPPFRTLGAQCEL